MQLYKYKYIYIYIYIFVCVDGRGAPVLPYLSRHFALLCDCCHNRFEQTCVSVHFGRKYKIVLEDL